MRRAIPPVLLFMAAFVIYVVNGRFVDTGDSLPARYLPWSLLRELDFDLDEFPVLYDEPARHRMPLLDGVPYYLRLRDGHYLSAYTPAPALFVLPLYAVPVLAGLPPGRSRRWPWKRFRPQPLRIVVCPLRPGGSGARRGGHLRRHRLLGEPAHPGDRHPDGSRRRLAPRPPGHPYRSRGGTAGGVSGATSR